MCRDLVDDVLQRDEQLFVWLRGATESIILFFDSNYPKPSVVLVRLVDEVPEDFIELPHILSTITFADVAVQRRTPSDHIS